MAYAEFDGKLDGEQGGFVEFTGEMDAPKKEAPSSGPSSFIGYVLDTAATAAELARPITDLLNPASVVKRREAEQNKSVLSDGMALPEQKFDPADPMYSSDRATAERAARPKGAEIRQPSKYFVTANQGNALERAADSFGSFATRSSSGGFRAASDLAKAVGADDIGTKLGEVSSGLGYMAGDTETGLTLRKSADLNDPAYNRMNALEKLGTKYGADILAQLPQVAISMVSGGIALPAVLSGFDAYSEARQKGMDPTKAAAYASVMGGFEAIGEKMGGMDKLADAFESAIKGGFTRNKAGELFARMAKSGAMEVPSEEITYVGQTGADKLFGVNNPTDKEFIQGAIDTAIVSAGSGGILGGAGAIGSKVLASKPDKVELMRQQVLDKWRTQGLSSQIEAPKLEALAAERAKLESMRKAVTPTPMETASAITSPDIQSVDQAIAVSEAATNNPVAKALDAEIASTTQEIADLESSAAANADQVIRDLIPEVNQAKLLQQVNQVAGIAQVAGTSTELSTPANPSATPELTPANPEVITRTNPSGTVTVLGNLVLAKKLLADAGVTHVVPSKDGLLVSKGQAERAAKAVGEAVVPVSVDATGKPASWVIREKATGNVVMETFDQKKVEALNTDKYEAVPIAQHLAGITTQNKTQPAQAETTGPRFYGINSQPVDEGGKPFKSQPEAKKAQKLQPHLRVKKVDGGFALTEKTAKQLAAEAQAAKRLGSIGTGGKPLAVHEFLASMGGLSKSTMSDLGFDKNMKLGGKHLFTNAGMSLERAVEMLGQYGYMQGTSQNDALALIQKSANGQPQYTPEGWDAIAQAEADARFADHLQAQHDAMQDDDFDPFASIESDGFAAEDIEEVGYDAASPAIKAEVNALLAQLEAAGVDAEMLREDVARETADKTEQEYYEQLKERAIQAISGGRSVGQDSRYAGEGNGQEAESAGRGNRSEADGGQGAQGIEGQGLNNESGGVLIAPTKDDVLANQDRAENAAAMDEREQIRRESEAGAGSFQLQAEDGRQDTTGGLFDQPGLKFSKANKDISVGFKPGTQFLQATSPAGLVGGTVKDGVLRITFAEVNEDQRGKGEGVKLYSALIDKALTDGLKVVSDSTVEATAVRVYESLGRRGYNVKRLEGGTTEDGAAYGKVAVEPAFAVVGGNVLRDASAAYNAESPRRPYTDDRQLQLFLDNGPVESQAGPRGEAAQREAVSAVYDLRSTETILAQALSSDYAARQRTSLVGQKVSSAEDLAVLAQLYRDPRFETFRVVFVNDSGNVVSQVGLTSRLPASTQAIMGDDMGAYLKELAATARNHGATRYYLLHNHPSGLAAPSSADISLTIAFVEEMPQEMEMAEHVVIDTNEYTTIDWMGGTKTFKKDFGQPAPYRAQEWADVKIEGPADVMALAKRLQVDDGAVTLVHTDNQYKVKSISTIPADALMSGSAEKHVTKASLRARGAQVFAVGRNASALRKLTGLVVDAIWVEDGGRVSSLRSTGTISGGKPFPESRRTRLSPDTSPEFAYLRSRSQSTSVQRVAEPGRNQTETPEFKAWFGDWEALRAQKRLDAMEPVKVRAPSEWASLQLDDLRERVRASLMELSDSGEPLHHPELGDVDVTRGAGVKKPLSSSRDPAKLLVLGDLRRTFESSIYATSSEPVQNEPGVRAYEKLLSRVQVDGRSMVAIFTVRKMADGRQFYNTVTLDDEQSKTPVVSPRDTPIAGERATSANTGVSSFLRQTLKRVNPDTVSKVVDADGKPLVVYHGTKADFSSFNLEKFGQTDGGWAGEGFYFAPNPDEASLYATSISSPYGNSTGANVMPVFLSAKNPLEWRIGKDVDHRIQSKRNELGAKAFAEWVQSQGYDSIHITSPDIGKVKGEDQWVVFKPEQVKSAIGNNGNYDPANQDISFSRKSLPNGNTGSASSDNTSDYDGESIVQRFNDRLTGTGTKIVFAQTFADLPADVQGRAIDAGMTDPMGMVDRGTVYLVGENIGTRAALEATIVHELYGHIGLRKLFGPEMYRKLNNLYLNLGDAKVKQLAEKYGLDKNGYFQAADALVGGASDAFIQRAGGVVQAKQGWIMEELLAHIAESETGKLKQQALEVVGAIRQWLRDHGFAKLEQMNMADIAHVLKRGRVAAVTQDNYRGMDVPIAFSRRGQPSQSGQQVPVVDLGRFSGLSQEAHPRADSPNLLERMAVKTKVFGYDEANRIALRPSAALYGLLGKGATPLLDKLRLTSANPEMVRQLRQMKLEVQEAQEKALKIAQATQQMSEEERKLISDIIEKDVKVGVIPPVHAVKLAGTMSTAMSAQSEELVRLGMLSQDAADRWDGTYLPRFYESKMRDKVDVWATALKKMMGRTNAFNGVNGKHLKSRGLFEVIDVADLPAYEQMGWKVRDQDYQAGLVQDGKVQVWRDFSRQERDKMGEIRDAGFRFVMGYMQTQKDIALGRMFEGMASNTDMASRYEREGWIRVPDSTIEGTGAKRYGKLAGMYVPLDVYSQLSHVEEQHNEVWAMYRKALSVWKESKTVLNPVSHVNNVVSNLTMAHLAGVSYWDGHKYVGAIKDLATGKGYIQEAKKAGLFLGTMSEAELLEVLPKDLRDLAGKQDGKLEKVVKNGYALFTYFLRKPLGAAYQAEDTFFRYLIYRDARNQGLDPQDAVDYAQKYIFTYDDLPQGARMIRDFGIPFFAYTYKFIPTALHTAANYPWRMAAPAAVFYAANAAMYALAAGDDDDEWHEKLKKYLTDAEYRKQIKAAEELERKNMPPWMQGYTSLMTPRALRLGTDELTNLPVFIDISRVIPGGDIFDVNPNAGGVPVFQWITPSNPLFTTGVAMFANKDLFFGKELVDKNDTRMEAAKKRMDWIYKQFTPAIAISNYHWDRSLNAIVQATGVELKYWPDFLGGDASGVGRDGLPVQPVYSAMQTFGIKARPIDLEKAEEIAKSQDNKLIRDIDAEISQLKRLSQRGAILDRVYEQKKADAEAKKARLKEGLTVDGDKK